MPAVIPDQSYVCGLIFSTTDDKMVVGREFEYEDQAIGQPIRTCWRDETTGALYPEVIPRYVAMLRKVQELGGFHHVFFITHSPDAAVLADAQIHVAGGRATIQLPPFTAAA